MSNNWNQPGMPTDASRDGLPKKTGGLLSGYRQQQQPVEQQSPALPAGAPVGRQMPPQPAQPTQFSPSNGRNPSSQFLPGRTQQAPQPQMPQQQRPMPAQPQQQGWMSNAMNFMRQVSGKMTAIGRNGYGQPAPYMERYHGSRPQAMPVPMEQPRLEEATPWKRSLSTRVAYKMRRRRDRWQSQQFGIGKILGIVAIILAVIAVLASSTGGVFAYNYYQQESTQVASIANKSSAQTTRIYDRNNQLIAERYNNLSDNSAGRSTPISYKDIPDVLKDAQTSIEDRTFWDNAGIDPQGILRAASSGNGGGSTITQQVIKNLSGNDQANYTRKLAEATLALGMTQQYPKWKILEMYFNSVPYGIQDLGVESAARDLFGLQPTNCDKNFVCTPAVKQLGIDPKTGKYNSIVALARASLLAGIPNNPTIYDPSISDTTRQAALDRQKLVLQNMQTDGKLLDGKPIDDDMIQQAEKLTASWQFKPYHPIKNAPHFADWVTVQMEQMLNNGDPTGQTGIRTFLSGGFNIKTTLDMNLQKYVENASRYFITQPTLQKFGLGANTYLRLNKDLNVNDAAVVVMDSKTGEVLAMSGSVDYYKDPNNKKVAGSFNVATATRPPGSTFKPFTYATAFQMGWNPGIVLPDVRTYFPNGAAAGAQNQEHVEFPYAPDDYGGKPNGVSGPRATIRQDLADSYNIPAIKALSFAGTDNVFNNARLMGITSLDANMQKRKCTSAMDCYHLTPGLGAVDITPLEMTSAYQTFANGGVHMPYQNILDVWDSYGNHLFHLDPTQVKGTRVFSPQVTYMMTSVLADEPARYYEFLYDHDLSFYDWEPGGSCADQHPYPSCPTHQVAAKTGTTDEFKDNWTMGYTPNVVVGVWAGNADDTSMRDGVVGITGAAPIWHAVMEFASGRPCADINADMNVKISCPVARFNPASDGMNRATTFSKPNGITIDCNLSAVDGLLGSGGKCDWVIDGQAPTLAGKTAVTNDPNGGNGGNGGGGKKRRG
ncbi:hypothetical protein KSC_051960 [Ktedonobacter sp. SOSP1-52]|uniref:transglycosylase domain-containing protein n=1 Tax=Ktedonobacter sp. SOSP1-52 TaxID=2778366 RepID=UPI001915CB28|nr:transglycosylase domain-containing protein [Ktedonobacter sp. SOSP1-52]GHO66304.1 hypothetical protein KSC_051960 [Ktedonobacter sp. SOSP1-52]